MRRIPLLYFQPAIVMIDDKKQFLENLSTYISYDGKINLYTNPESAIKYINSKTSISQDFGTLIRNISASEFSNDILFNAIYNLLFLKNKTDEIAVVITDYVMPRVSGIDVCIAINNKSIKRILLTGEGDNEIAVKCFNQGLIDRFVTKNLHEISSGLIKIINGLIYDFFIYYSEILAVCIDDSISINRNYICIFEKWVMENNIIEYYATSENGSKIGVDTKGNIKYLLISTDQEIESYIDIAKNANINSEYIQKLEKKENHLLIFTEKQKKSPITEWARYSFPINGRFDNEFNYSYVNILSTDFF